MSNNKVRITRVLEYIGDRDWVERKLQIDSINFQGITFYNGENIIKSGIVGTFPDSLDEEQCRQLDLICSDEEKAIDLLKQSKLILTKGNYDGRYEEQLESIDKIINDIKFKNIPY